MTCTLAPIWYKGESNKKIMNKTFTLSEKSLIVNCINRNRKSQKELFDRYSPKMFPICLHYAKNQIDAEDIMQNAFVKVFNNLPLFTGDKSLEEWIRRIFINTATQHTKRNKVKIAVDEGLTNKIIEEHIIQLNDLYEDIYIKTSDKFRKDGFVFKLYAVNHSTAEETTEVPGTVESNVKTPAREEKKPLIRVVQNTTQNPSPVKLRYTIQKGDDRRLNRDGGIRVYNLREPLDIPVKKLLGKWKNEHVGVTLMYMNEKWIIEGEMVQHTINRLETKSRTGLKRLLSFV